ncbi:response regulator [Pseudomonas sp. Z4-20]|uniref:response regulator n=1 Tax=Pseudomonas sp. Z4-20 TaxID=2817414 RepID=UPI003DA88504
MPNKALRIMIADPLHFHRMQLERLFNHLGYFRIAPVSDVHEFLTLVDYGCEPFDLVVVNASLAKRALDLPGFCLDNLQVRHGLIYNAQEPPLGTLPAGRRACLQMMTAHLPDAVSLRRLMKGVDPEASESAQPWEAPSGRGTAADVRR